MDGEHFRICTWCRPPVDGEDQLHEEADGNVKKWELEKEERKKDRSFDLRGRGTFLAKGTSSKSNKGGIGRGVHRDELSESDFNPSDEASCEVVSTKGKVR